MIFDDRVTFNNYTKSIICKNTGIFCIKFEAISLKVPEWNCALLCCTLRNPIPRNPCIHDTLRARISLFYMALLHIWQSMYIWGLGDFSDNKFSDTKFSEANFPIPNLPTNKFSKTTFSDNKFSVIHIFR